MVHAAGRPCDAGWTYANRGRGSAQEWLLEQVFPCFQSNPRPGFPTFTFSTHPNNRVHAEVVMAAVAAQRRPLGALGRMSLVAVIHVAVLFAIAKSLGIGSAPVEERMTATIEEAERPPVELPPPPPEFIPTTTQSVVLPDIPTDIPYESTDVITPPPDVPFVEDPPPVAPPQAQVVGVRPDPRHPLSKPEY